MEAGQSDEASCELLGENIQGAECAENTENKGDVPKTGMAFQSLDELFEFYWKFAQKEGFGVVKQSCGKGLNGQLKYQTFSCDRAGKGSKIGKPRLRHRPTKRNGCSARVCASIGPNGLWKINKVTLEHTHDLNPSGSAEFLRQRLINEYRKRNLDINSAAGIKPCNSVCDCDSVADVGEHENMICFNKDCRNSFENARKRNMNENDKILPSQDAYKKLYEDRTYLFNMLRNEVRKMFDRLPTLLDPSIFKSIILIADDPLSTLVDLFETELEQSIYSTPNNTQPFLRDNAKS